MDGAWSVLLIGLLGFFLVSQVVVWAVLSQVIQQRGRLLVQQPRYLLPGSMAILLAILTACSAPVPPASSPTGAPTKLPVTFVYALGTDGSQNYDPHTAANAYVYTYLAPVFDTLVAVGRDGTVKPALATTWEFSDDTSTLTLHLRQNVVFHDGTPFNAEAVQANIKRGQTLATSTVRDQLKSITSMDVVDPATIRLYLSGGAGAILPNLADRPGMMLSPAVFDNSDLSTHPVGTGPWQVSPESVVGKEMVYTAFANYWDPSVQKIQTLRIRVLGDQAAKAAIIDHSVDLASLTVLQTARDLKNAGITVMPTAIENLNIVYLNKANTPFKDERVRQALSLAINRQQLADVVLEKTCTVDSQPFEPTSRFYKPGFPPTPFDLNRARILLSEAGFPNGFSFTAIVIAGAPTYLDQMQAMQPMLEQVGIKMTIRELPPAQLLKTFTGGESEAYFSSFPGASDAVGVVATLAGTLNPGGYSDPELSRLAGEGASALDVNVRTAAYQNWGQRWQDTAFDIAICNQPTPYAAQRGVSGVQFLSPAHLDPRGLSKE